MKDAQMIILSPERWEEYKALRLKALKTNPEAFGITYGEALKREDKEWQRMLRNALEEKERWVVFAKYENKLCGMAQATIEDGVIKVKAVFVDPEVRNLGIGKKIMRELLKKVKRGSNIKKVHLGMYLPNEKALKLYKSLGGQEISRGIEVLPDGRKKPRALMEINFV